jgi:hypothetical protein
MVGAPAYNSTTAPIPRSGFVLGSKAAVRRTWRSWNGDALSAPFLRIGRSCHFLPLEYRVIKDLQDLARPHEQDHVNRCVEDVLNRLHFERASDLRILD